MKLTPSNLKIFFLFAGFLAHSLSIHSQSNSADIYKDIKKFGVLANVLYVAAHPDDENTRMISYLSNHLSANTTYLSITRGDGGQNLIGPEMREMLGVIRTHELLEARKIDGGNQMFTRANDFGYSKSARETFKIWDKEEVLSDVVWAIRNTRPDVIINRFNTDTLRPNHGHHTASAILSVNAFDLAGSRESFAEQLKYVEPWQPHRIFFNTSWFFFGSRENFEKADKSKMLAVDIGSFDQVTGESNSEIAGRSRSMHKSQGFGSAETRGESLDYLDLVKDTKGVVPKNIFEGIDITWNRVQGGARLAELSDKLERTFDFKTPSKSITLLMEIRNELRALPDSFWKTKKTSECEHLIKECLGLFVEMRTNQFKASPSSTLPVTLEVINRSDANVQLTGYTDNASNKFELDTSLAFNRVFLKEIFLKMPDELSTPYWLVKQGSEGMYNVEDQKKIGQPANPPTYTAYVDFVISGQNLSIPVPLVFRTVDPAEGEIYRPVYITPPVTIERNAEVMMFTKGAERLLHLTLTSMQDSVSGMLELTINEPGWKVTPKQIEWSFDKTGETMAVSATITPPQVETEATLQPVLKVGDQKFHHTVTSIDYPHLPYMSVVRDASMKLVNMDIKTTPRAIAYIEGAGDDVAEGLEQLGYRIDILNPSDISPMIINKYQVIILGVRAFNTVEELAFKNKLLFDWVKTGGTMIVQYNTNRELVTNDIAPYPLTISRDRVTEESSPVTILDPQHNAMKYPNVIDQDDFINWVQERGLYFPNQWDAQFTPLLEMKDSGEDARKGALLVAPYGEGYYVYSGLSWFRHLPAGIPGAYRLLSNIISLGYKNNKS